MKICTCNNCGNIWEDPNPCKESIEYPEINIPQLEWLDDGAGGHFLGCPECETDGYLVDNVNFSAMPLIKGIIFRKDVLGQDCTEDESAAIKGWLRDTIIQPGAVDVNILESIQISFPLEYDEYIGEENKTKEDSFSFDEKIGSAIKNAEEAFWWSIAQSFPEIKTGDFPPDASEAFSAAAKEAVQTWIKFNKTQESEDGD